MRAELVVGFTTLISYFYPIVGYAGILIIGVMIYGWIQKRKQTTNEDSYFFQIHSLRLNIFINNETRKYGDCIFRYFLVI